MATTGFTAEIIENLDMVVGFMGDLVDFLGIGAGIMDLVVISAGITGLVMIMLEAVEDTEDFHGIFATVLTRRVTRWTQRVTGRTGRVTSLSLPPTSWSSSSPRPPPSWTLSIRRLGRHGLDGHGGRHHGPLHGGNGGFGKGES